MRLCRQRQKGFAFHAEALIQNGEYLLHELGSKLGTSLNGVRIDQAKLNGGDRVQLGGAK